jgi:hypothetical protein
MPLVSAKCSQCGATVDVDNDQKYWKCQNCGTIFFVEDAINNYTTVINNSISNTINADSVIITGKNIENIRTLADRYYEEKEYDEAFKYYTQLLEEFPSDPYVNDHVFKSKCMRQFLTNQIESKRYKETDLFLYKNPEKLNLFTFDELINNVIIIRPDYIRFSEFSKQIFNYFVENYNAELQEYLNKCLLSLNNINNRASIASNYYDFESFIIKCLTSYEKDKNPILLSNLGDIGLYFINYSKLNLSDSLAKVYSILLKENPSHFQSYLSMKVDELTAFITNSQFALKFDEFETFCQFVLNSLKAQIDKPLLDKVIKLIVVLINYSGSLLKEKLDRKKQITASARSLARKLIAGVEQFDKESANKLKALLREMRVELEELTKEFEIIEETLNSATTKYHLSQYESYIDYCFSRYKVSKKKEIKDLIVLIIQFFIHYQAPKLSYSFEKTAYIEDANDFALTLINKLKVLDEPLSKNLHNEYSKVVVNRTKTKESHWNILFSSLGIIIVVVLVFVFLYNM